MTTVTPSPSTAFSPTGRTRPPTLPLGLTAFVGRDVEMRSLEEVLRVRRLLTLTGAGGTGKTRLAVELAARVAGGYPDGVAWVELAALADPDLLPRHVAAVLGIPEDGGRSAVESLEDALRHRSFLLVLDNCEHLVGASAALADNLLRACPHLRVLTTSREALGVEGECAWLVPPLTIPGPADDADPDRIAEFEASRLFVARARDVVSVFRLTSANSPAVAGICRRLDGLPLAIELAAARVKVLTPDQIMLRLDDAFGLLTTNSRLALPRHRTLRATIDWSYQLLTEPARVLLHRLSVFSGGWSLDAVETVCAGDGIGDAEVLDLVAELVDQSLVTMREDRGTARYSLLEIVRQYAREALGADPHALVEAQRRHAAYYAMTAEPLHADLERRNSPDALATFILEQDNFRTALTWVLGDGDDPDLTIRMVAACWRWWFHANRWAEGAQWCETVLAAHPDRRPSLAWGNILTAAGVFAYLGRDPARAQLRLEEGETMARALGDPELVALMLYRLAHLYCDIGDGGLARARAEEAASLARETGEDWVLAEVLVYGTGFVHRMQGRADEADRAFAEAEALARPAGALMALMEAHAGRAMLALDRGDAPAATVHAAGAFDAAQRLGDHWFVSRALLIAAAAASQAQDVELAARLLGCGAALREAVGTQVFPHEQGFFDDIATATNRLLPDGEYTRIWNEGAALSLVDAGALVAAAAGPSSSSGAGDAPFSGSRAGGITPRPGPTVDSTRGAPPGLHVLAMGEMEVYRHGELQTSAAWPYAKPKELLVLLMLNPEGLSRERIGQAIWPGTTSAQAKNSFHVTLHHLRKALGGAHWIVNESDRYRFVPEPSAELDATRFEEEARRLLRETDPPEETLCSTLSLYRGDLLEGEVTGPWVEEHRDRLRRLAVDLKFALGAALEAREEHAGAAALYQGLVAREELNEEAHRRLMRAWARAGDRARALQHYQRLLVLLRDEFDAAPEPETAAFHEALRLGTVG